MAQIELTLENPAGVQVTMTVENDQDLKVPTLVDPSGWKQADQLVPGDYVCSPAGGRRPVTFKVL